MKEQAKQEMEVESVALPRRQRLPATRKGLVHKFSVGNVEGYVIVGLYPDGSLGEIFLHISKEGSTLSGVMDAFATLTSIALQSDIPLEVLVKKFRHVRFEPCGVTRNREIPMASSIVDYIFRWLELRFLSGEKQAAS
jgi:ribonucleoside-diphosphate reductase alpha chain